ncbi:MAG: hypothetical protein E7C83_05715, partial [Corynebacterium sp.]|uniref:hypothetical protein n=1 Tax=Corynebacterium sp. TaxID=1720 RepID=UPI002903FBBC
EAKPAHADGTATGRLWESKSPPTPNNTTKYRNNEAVEDNGHHKVPESPTASFVFLPRLPGSPA